MINGAQSKSRKLVGLAMLQTLHFWLPTVGVIYDYSYFFDRYLT